MKKALFLGIIICFGCGMLLSLGCAKKAASTTSEAVTAPQPPAAAAVQQ